MERVIETTEDGSVTLFVPELNEHYHSTKGARTESEHIFIRMGLQSSIAIAPRILEIGLGTGLNAFLTFEEAEKNQRKVFYTGIELYPLNWEMVEPLGYHGLSPLLKVIHTSPWEVETVLSPYFTIHKIQADANQWLAAYSGSCFDLVYFDAFAPEKQPEMWSQELFNRLYVLLNRGGILTTYCAKGMVRRMLQTAGFIVERLPGPPGGKREILRAMRP